MNKIQLEIIGISTTPVGNNAYALLMNEVGGNRRVPIVVGSFEAQAIALQLEGVVPPRPLTHDLFKNLIDKFGASVDEVYINDLHEGTFYSQIIIETMGIEIDARPSDAIAIAVRFEAPVYIREDILEETAITIDPEDLEKEDEYRKHNISGKFSKKEKTTQKGPISLDEELNIAIENEDYERAAEIRDEMQKLKNSN
ncbi:MAG: hypothetical protein B7C24_15005 [Bacteroidetes bacterium 4572_77]|nr:MAG: hypothetical protein B7C24_15005 [Bacteroidetes bacterium 4572_77]